MNLQFYAPWGSTFEPVTKEQEKNNRLDTARRPAAHSGRDDVTCRWRSVSLINEYKYLHLELNTQIFKKSFLPSNIISKKTETLI